jgi:hypothetical protein
MMLCVSQMAQSILPTHLTDFQNETWIHRRNFRSMEYIGYLKDAYNSSLKT